MFHFCYKRLIRLEIFSFFRLACFFTAIPCALSACSNGRPVLYYGLNADPSSALTEKASSMQRGQSAAIVPVYIATNRALQDNPSLPFGSQRSSQLNFALVNIGIPPAHKKGLIEKNSKKPDPARHFAAVGFELYNTQQNFKHALNKALARKTGRKKEIFLFIHGYNNNFAESTFRAAQIAYDYKLDVVTVHYAWPSGGALGLYVYDRDSSVFARDSLANFLQLISETNATDITVAAHSMGSYVTLEAMRTLSLKGKQRVIDRISTLLMAAPDVDVDVFEQQLRDIRRLPKATAVQVSKKDRALTISRRITGGHPRVGDGSSITLLRHNGIVVFDMSNVDGGTHSVFASSPTLMKLIQEGTLSHSVLAGDIASPEDIILASGSSTLEEATSLILYMPIRILSSVHKKISSLSQ